MELEIGEYILVDRKGNQSQVIIISDKYGVEVIPVEIGPYKGNIELFNYIWERVNDDYQEIFDTSVIDMITHHLDTYLGIQINGKGYLCKELKHKMATVVH